MPGWLGTDAKPIIEGWGPAPKLEAPNIGALVSSILTNRFNREELAQKSVADAIKQYRQDQAANAYLEQARAAGVLPEGDLSGEYGAAYGSKLASEIAAQKREAYMQPYYKALTGAANRRPAPGRGSDKIWIPELGGYGTPDQAFQVRSKQSGLLGKQAEDIASEQEDYGLKPDVKPAAHGYVMRDGKMDYARTPKEQASPALVSPSDPITDPNAPTFTPDVYKQREAQSALRQKILGQQKSVQDKMLTPPTDGGGGGGGGAGGQLPEGTRGRVGDKWYVKQADGSWQPEG